MRLSDHHLILLTLIFFVLLLTGFIIHIREEYEHESFRLKYRKKSYYIQEEETFPLAFSLVVHRDVDQVERLLRAIYRPFNIYCIHIDDDSSLHMHNFAQRLNEQYPNVILPRTFIRIEWGSYSVLEAQLMCLEALLHHIHKINWKYVINLTGQEWPLKTNLELVRILKVLNGSNLVEKKKMKPGRVRPGTRVPYNIRLWSGSMSSMLTYKFAFFLYTDQRVRDFSIFLQDHTYFPEEIFFSTVSHSHKLNPPGGYSGFLGQDPERYPDLNRYQVSPADKCHGRWERMNCIFGTGDIPSIVSTSNRQLFAYKFVTGINDDVFNFMEDWFYKRAKLVYMFPDMNPFIHLEFYTNLSQVKNHW